MNSVQNEIIGAFGVVYVKCHPKAVICAATAGTAVLERQQMLGARGEGERNTETLQRDALPGWSELPRTHWHVMDSS